MSGEDGVTERAGIGGWSEGRLHGRMRNCKEAEQKEQLSQAQHLGEQEIMCQSCRDSGMVSQARLKYKWGFSLSCIKAILVNEEKGGWRSEGKPQSQGIPSSTF